MFFLQSNRELLINDCKETIWATKLMCEYTLNMFLYYNPYVSLYGMNNILDNPLTSDPFIWANAMSQAVSSHKCLRKEHTHTHTPT